MDKKIKKKLDVLHQKMQKLQQQIAAAKQQNDEPEELQRLQAELEAAEKEVAKLRSS